MQPQWRTATLRKSHDTRIRMVWNALCCIKGGTPVKEAYREEAFVKEKRLVEVGVEIPICVETHCCAMLQSALAINVCVCVHRSASFLHPHTALKALLSPSSRCLPTFCPALLAELWSS